MRRRMTRVAAVAMYIRIDVTSGSDDMADEPHKKTSERRQRASRRRSVMSTSRNAAETFADSVNSVFFDGQTMRIEFGITRMDEMKKDQPLTGRRYPACRLVLAPAAAIDLINKMQQTAQALQQAGLVKPAEKPAARAKRTDFERFQTHKESFISFLQGGLAPAIGSAQGGRSCAAYLQFQEPT